MDRLLLKAILLAKGLDPTPAHLERVAASTSIDASREAFAQWELRHRAAKKFERAQEMLFVREALEQATHETVAAYHASRFPVGVPVADLTVGIGSDLIALARRGPVRGFEIDPKRADYARHNLDVHGLEAEVVERDCLEAEWHETCAWADPSRRSSGVRTLDPHEFEPDPSRIAERMRTLRLGGIKLSPMLEDAYLDSLGGSVEFLSFGGECREAVVWLGELAGSGRRAVQVESGQALSASEEPPATDELDTLFFEADPAAIRAHALGTICAATGYRAVCSSNGYLTGGAPTSPLLRCWLRAWRVLDVLPFDRKQVRAALRRLDASLTTVKSRGIRLDAAQVHRQLRCDGSRPIALAVYPTSQGVRAALLDQD